jgi:hypothetical protein
MHPLLPTSALICALVGSPTASAGNVSVFVGESDQLGNVKVFDASGGPAFSPSELQGIRLRSLDFGGRVELLDYQPGRPHRAADLPNAARLVLPGGVGSLYRYERPSSDGSVAHGLFLVDASGVAKPIWDFSDSGSGVDPWLDRIAVAPAADSLLVATTLAAGGDLWEIDLATHSGVCRTTNVPPLDFSGDGLALGFDFGVAVASTGILRFARGSVGDAIVVDYSNCSAPTWFGREVVLSSNGLYAATIAGSAPDAAHPFVLDGCNAAVSVDPVPRLLASAGFLPEHLSGPYLAVSDDGSRCAWSALEPGPETYLALVPQTGAGAGVHVTHDALFHPFLDEIGLYAFTPSGRLHMGVGDRLDSTLGGLTRMDLFGASLAPDGASLSVTDLSQSTGSSYPPFNYYPLLQADHVSLSPDRSWSVVYSNPTGNDGLVLVVPTDGHGIVPVAAASGLEDLAFWELTSSELLMGGERVLANGEVEELYRVPYGFFTTASAVLPIADDELGAAHVRSDGWAGLATPNDLDEQWLWRFDTTAGTVQKFTSRSFDYGPTLWVDAQGSLACSIGQIDHPSLFLVWHANGAVKRLQPTPFKGFVLPGP